MAKLDARNLLAILVGLIFAIIIFMLLMLPEGTIYVGTMAFGVLIFLLIFPIPGAITVGIAKMNTTRDMFLIVSLLSFLIGLIFPFIIFIFHRDYSIILIFLFLMFFILGFIGTSIGGLIVFKIKNRKSIDLVKKSPIFKPTLKKIVVYFLLFIPGVFFAVIFSTMTGSSYGIIFEVDLYVIILVLSSILAYFVSCLLIKN